MTTEAAAPPDLQIGPDSSIQLSVMAPKTGRVVLADHAYEQIRGALIRGEIPSGEKLTEVSLAEELSMSRTPIREALRRLESEHLAVRDGVTLVAAEFDLDAAIELLVMRSLLEPKCAEMSAPLLTSIELSRLRILAAETDALEDPLALAELNNDFHTLLYSRCPYKRLLSEVDSMREHQVTYRLYAAYGESDLTESGDEHAELAETAAKTAAGESEPEELGEMVLQHLVRARESLERNAPDLWSEGAGK